jgi:hypothetical protein
MKSNKKCIKIEGNGSFLKKCSIFHFNGEQWKWTMRLFSANEPEGDLLTFYCTNLDLW